jgi:FG-GAP-like repeat
MIFRRPLLIAISIFIMATADVSGAWLGPPARAAYRRLIDAREQQAAHPPAHAGSAAGSEQDDTVRLRHRSEISNPYHVEFRDVTSAAGIHFHHERASSPQRLYPETMGAGVGWIDYNQDGYLDAIFVNSGYTPYYHPLVPPQPALYRNNRDGSFTDVTEQSKIHSDGTFFFRRGGGRLR